MQLQHEAAFSIALTASLGCFIIFLLPYVAEIPHSQKQLHALYAAYAQGCHRDCGPCIHSPHSGHRAQSQSHLDSYVHVTQGMWPAAMVVLIKLITNQYMSQQTLGEIHGERERQQEREREKGSLPLINHSIRARFLEEAGHPLTALSLVIEDLELPISQKVPCHFTLCFHDTCRWVLFSRYLAVQHSDPSALISMQTHWQTATVPRFQPNTPQFAAHYSPCCNLQRGVISLLLRWNSLPG